MSETIVIPPINETQVKKTPTVYFIDDSATMREVIKIAFRRESISVITCADAASALAQFEQHAPDVVITDVIMPDQDGYSVCSQIKQSPQYGKTPVILMSGVVNKSVADRAVAVQADELVRKPFQPSELISRVKTLLGQTAPQPAASTERSPAAAALTSLFAPPPQPPRVMSMPSPQPPAPPLVEQRPTESVWPRALADAFLQQNSMHPSQASGHPVPQTQRTPAGPSDVTKFRAEIARLELLVKKLQTELQIARQYNQALELHVRALTEVDQ